MVQLTRANHTGSDAPVIPIIHARTLIYFLIIARLANLCFYTSTPLVLLSSHMNNQ